MNMIHCENCEKEYEECSPDGKEIIICPYCGAERNVEASEEQIARTEDADADENGSSGKAPGFFGRAAGTLGRIPLWARIAGICAVIAILALVFVFTLGQGPSGGVGTAEAEDPLLAENETLDAAVNVEPVAEPPAKPATEPPAKPAPEPAQGNAGSEADENDGKTWVPDSYETIEHPAEYTTTHHPDVYTTINHPEVKSDPFYSDDGILISEGMILQEAWDEQILVKEAWDEQVLVKAAWTEEILIPGHWE